MVVVASVVGNVFWKPFHNFFFYLGHPFSRSFLFEAPGDLFIGAGGRAGIAVMSNPDQFFRFTVQTGAQELPRLFGWIPSSSPSLRGRIFS